MAEVYSTGHPFKLARAPAWGLGLGIVVTLERLTDQLKPRELRSQGPKARAKPRERSRASEARKGPRREQQQLLAC
jgi:hypothetical protein